MFHCVTLFTVFLMSFDINKLFYGSVHQKETKQSKTQVDNKRYSRGDVRNYLTGQVSAIFLLAQELEKFECQQLQKHFTDVKHVNNL